MELENQYEELLKMHQLIVDSKKEAFNNYKKISKYQKQFEIWKIIDGYENYEISSFGRLQNNKTGKIMKCGIDKQGYRKANLSKNGKRMTMKIHRLVAKAFLKNPNNFKIVDHINNIKTDNNIGNLRFSSQQENCLNKSIGKNNKSGVKGVFKFENKWMSEITFKGKTYSIGCFDNIEDAKKSRQEKAKQLYGEFLNECEK